MAELRICRVFQPDATDDADRFLEASRLQHGMFPASPYGNDIDRFPPDVMRFSNGLGSEFPGGKTHEHICAGGLDGHNLLIHGGVGDFVGHLRHDESRRLVPQAVLETLQEVFAEVIILIQDPDPGVGMMAQKVVRIGIGLDLVAGNERHRPREVLRVMKSASDSD